MVFDVSSYTIFYWIMNKEHRIVNDEEVKNKGKFNLEERLISFSVLIIEIAESMPQKWAGNYLFGQLIKSGISPSLNYGEAQSSESRKDFIHKIKIVLKELRETFVCLKIICRSKLYITKTKIILALEENNELISIFLKSVETAQKNLSVFKNQKS